MKRTVCAVILGVSLFSMLTLTQIQVSVKAGPRMWTVDDDGPADFHSIQGAISSPEVVGGDTIYVRSGTYYEHLVVNKPLTLVGESRDSTIVDGGGENRTVVEVTASNVIISEFTVQNSSRVAGTSYAGIRVFGRACNVTSNHVTKCKIGIFVTSQKIRVAENVATGNGQSIALSDASDVTVETNNVSESTVGISLARSFGNRVVNNSVTNSYQGGHGITLSSSFNNTVSGNVLVGNFHGMWLSGLSDDNLVVGNTVADNELLGIELGSSSDNVIYNNYFFSNGPARMRHVVIDGISMNVWDGGYRSGGNYWDGYGDVDVKNGPDQDLPGSDGIWDSPYIIDENNRDRYPFVFDKTEPVADAGPDQMVEVGALVFFDGSGASDIVGIVDYEWDFGDGTFGTGLVCSHTYVEPGNYKVTLTVKDAAGYFDVDFTTVTVLPIEVSPLSWRLEVIAVVTVTVIVAAVFWRYWVSKKGRRRRRRKHVTRKIVSSGVPLAF